MRKFMTVFCIIHGLFIYSYIIYTRAFTVFDVTESVYYWEFDNDGGRRWYPMRGDEFMHPILMDYPIIEIVIYSSILFFFLFLSYTHIKFLFNIQKGNRQYVKLIIVKNVDESYYLDEKNKH